MKRILTVIFAMGLAFSAIAQQINPGDTVRLDRNCTHYLTGEKISAWVYDTPLTVKQVGCKTYPDGILLREVLSWVSLEAVGASKTTPEPEPAPVVEVVPEPELVVEPEPEPEPVVEVVPEPVVEVIPEPAAEPQPLPSAEQRLGIGLRGGIASLCQKTNDNVSGEKTGLGGAAALDMEYTWLSAPMQKSNCRLGVKTGISFAFAANSISADGAFASYALEDSEGRAIIYTNSAAAITEKHQQLMVEIPVQFALRSKEGITFAFGPKFNIPLLGRYSQTYSEPVIDCYYSSLGVHETNQLVTGRLNGMAAAHDRKLRTATFNLLLGTEIGYQWLNGLGLALYGDYAVYSAYKTNNDPTGSFIYVSGPKPGGAEITGNALMNDCGKRMGYYSLGLKLSYSFLMQK